MQEKKAEEQKTDERIESPPEEKKIESPPEEKTESPPKRKAAPKRKPEPKSELKKPETVEEAVETYNEMVLTAIDLGISKIAAVKMFVDLSTGVKACERLHASIERARDPKSKKEEKDMAKKSKKSATKKAARSTTGKVKLTDETKITWSGKKNPFREKTGAWTRTEKVRENSGQTVKTLRSKKVKTGTIRTLLRLDLVKAS
jgi:hypothetical protein